MYLCLSQRYVLTAKQHKINACRKEETDEPQAEIKRKRASPGGPHPASPSPTFTPPQPHPTPPAPHLTPNSPHLTSPAPHPHPSDSS